MEKILKIDIHAHATAYPDYFPKCLLNNRIISVEELIGYYDKLGVEKGMLLPISAPEAQVTVLSSECCAYLANKYSDRLFWYCNVDPRAVDNTPGADLVSLLAAYKEMGAKGVGEITAQLYADDERMDNLFSACEELDMPALIHIGTQNGGCYGIIDEIGLPRIEKMLKKHPNLKLIGHSQAFWAEISDDVTEQSRKGYPKGKVNEGRMVKLMREYPNLYADLSATSGSNAIMRDEEFGAKFIEEFSDRIMYGCDVCLNTQTFPFPFAEHLDKLCESGMISEESFRKIARENAIKVFKL